MLTISELLFLKREHIRRLANRNGAAGEAALFKTTNCFLPRPTGAAMKTLMTVLKERGIAIRPTSFDAIALPEGITVDCFDINSVRSALPQMTFIEIKTAKQTRVQADFAGFFFALTEGEISAAEALGERHRVLLHNQTTGAQLLTSVPEILARARSMNWQLSVQL